MTKLNKLYFDMEMSSLDDEIASTFPTASDPSHNIISIVCYDESINTYYVLLYRDDLVKKKSTMKRTLTGGKEVDVVLLQSPFEVDVLVGFAQLCKKNADILLGWNINEFDFPYYFARCKRLNIFDKVSKIFSPKYIFCNDKYFNGIPGYIVFDLMKGAKKILGNYAEVSLSKLSKTYLKLDKLGDTMDAIESWYSDIDLLIDYNIRDVELTVLLDYKLPIVSYFMEQMAITGADIDTTFDANYKVCERIIHYNKSVHTQLDDFMIPTVKEFKKEKMSGAITLQSVPGLHDNIGVHDLSQMYPSIIIALNMSPETKVYRKDYTDDEWEAMNPCFTSSGTYFRQDFVGYFPKLIIEYTKLRYEIEDQIEKFAKEYGDGHEKTDTFEVLMTKRLNVKGIINSFFGIFGYEKFTFYDNDIADGVTKTGQEQLLWSKEFVWKKYGIKTIYGDTDSIFIYTPVGIVEIRFIVEFHEKVGIEITKSYDDFAKQYNIKHHEFNMKFEKLYKKIIFVKIKNSKKGSSDIGAKKRYAGLIIYKDGKSVKKNDIVGFESKRSNTSKLLKYTQSRTLDIILNTDENVKENVSTLVRKYYKAASIGRIKYKDLALIKGLGKNLEEYNSKTYSWYAIEYANRNLYADYKKGDKIHLVPLLSLPPNYKKMNTKKNPERWIAYTTDNPLPKVLDEYINYPLLTEKSMYSGMESLLKSLGIDLDYIKTGRRKITL